MTENCSWQAYLSDGRTINDKDLYVPGEILPFKKLIRKCKTEGVEINAVTLNIKGVRYNSPSLSERGNFTSINKPKRFWVQYRERFIATHDKGVPFISLSWEVGDIRTTLWVNSGSEKPISWVEIRPIGTAALDMVIQEYYGDGK